jgi:hypothetical protein
MIHFFKAFSSIIWISKRLKKVYISWGNSQWRYHATDGGEFLPYAEAINFKDALYIFHNKGSIFKEFLLLLIVL